MEEKYLERLVIIVGDEDFALAQALVSQHLMYGWEEESLADGSTCITCHCEEAKVLDELVTEISSFIPYIEVRRSKIEQKDWTNAWKEYFTPIQAREFLIVPPWLKDSNDNPPHKHQIIIEPKSAFGTGHHASTVLCLEAISILQSENKIDAGQKFLDLGTGTGILGIACVKYGLTGFGLDIETLAVANAKENCELNSINVKEDDFIIEFGSIDKAKNQEFDLIIANILAAPLREMASEIIKCLKPNGRLILSGFLENQCQELEKCYGDLGQPRKLTKETDMRDGKWVSFFW